MTYAETEQAYIFAIQKERGLTLAGAKASAANVRTLEGKAWKAVLALLTPEVRKLALALREHPGPAEPAPPRAVTPEPPAE